MTICPSHHCPWTMFNHIKKQYYIIINHTKLYWTIFSYFKQYWTTNTPIKPPLAVQVKSTGPVLRPTEVRRYQKCQANTVASSSTVKFQVKNIDFNDQNCGHSQKVKTTYCRPPNMGNLHPKTDWIWKNPGCLTRDALKNQIWHKQWFALHILI